MSETRALEFFKWNNFEAALVEYERAGYAQLVRSTVSGRPNDYANYYHAMTLLALGRYRDGFAKMCRLRGKDILERCAGRPVWRGETDAPVTIVHEAGYGDGIQMMRYVPAVQAQAKSVTLDVPEPLRRLARQLAPLAIESDGYVCPWFDLMLLFEQTPALIPSPPYLKPDPELVEHWAHYVGNGGGGLRIGIAWETRYGMEANQAECRPIELEKFLKLLSIRGELFSLQTQERNGALIRGVRAFTIDDFADVAALISLMDVVVSVDTAALHLAGALGHPKVFGLLPYAATWRWVGNHWYPNVKLCQQTFPGDWESAFRQIERG